MSGILRNSFWNRGKSKIAITSFFTLRSQELMTWSGLAKKIATEQGLGHEGKIVKDNNYRSFATRPADDFLHMHKAQ